MIKRLHVSGQSWFKAAEQCCLYLASKVATMLSHSSCVTFQPSQQRLPLYKIMKNNHSLSVVARSCSQWSRHLSVGFTGHARHHGAHWPVERAANSGHVQAEENWAWAAWAAEHHSPRRQPLAQLLQHSEQVSTRPSTKGRVQMFSSE